MDEHVGERVGPSTAREREAPVLVVEDDPGVRQVIEWALEDDGLPV